MPDTTPSQRTQGSMPEPARSREFYPRRSVAEHDERERSVLENWIPRNAMYGGGRDQKIK
jgi:hypothetical protein